MAPNFPPPAAPLCPLPVPAGVQVQLSSGQTITGRLLVYAAAPTCPVLPAWAKLLLHQVGRAPAAEARAGAAAANNGDEGCSSCSREDQAKASATSGGTTGSRVGCGESPKAAPAAQAAQSSPGDHPSEGYSFPPGLLTFDQVDLNGAEVAGRHVVVVGGGMTAATLAAGAVARGARVTMVCRR